MSAKKILNELIVEMTPLLTTAGYSFDRAHNRFERKSENGLTATFTTFTARSSLVVIAGVHLAEVNNLGFAEPDGNLSVSIEQFDLTEFGWKAHFHTRPWPARMASIEPLAQAVERAGVPVLEKLANRQWILENWKLHRVGHGPFASKEQRVEAVRQKAGDSRFLKCFPFRTPGHVCAAAILARDGRRDEAVQILSNEAHELTTLLPAHARYLREELIPLIDPEVVSRRT